MIEAKNQFPESTGIQGREFVDYGFRNLFSVHYNENKTSEVPIFYSFPSRYSDGYKNELNHFLDVVQVTK